MMVRRLSWMLAWTLLAVTHAGCGEDSVSQGRPDVEIGPMSPLTLRFKNTAKVPLFIDWSGDQAHFVLSRGGQSYRLSAEQLPLCEQRCNCPTTDSPQPTVRRVEPGQELTLQWEPVHFEVRSCNGQTTCQCAELWPLTAGQYELRLEGYEQVEGGQVDEQNPEVVRGARLNLQSTRCQAVTSFALMGGAQVQADFSCQP